MSTKALQTSYVLLDGEYRNRQYSTFEIPPEEERKNCNVGDVVKLGFEQRCKTGEKINGERMWVEIVHVDETPDGKVYTGKLKNDPVVFPDLKYDSTVVFYPKHIISI